MKYEIPVVTGTTGWNAEYEEIKQECKNLNAAVLFASNFSIGVNIWFDLIKDAAKRFSKLMDYNMSLKEIHHLQKLDKPSGTAITAAKHIIESDKSFSSWSLTENKEDILKIESVRESDVNGIHELLISSDFDNIKISHEAINRNGFALGAVKAAEWLIEKKGFLDFHEFYQVIFDETI